MKYLQFCGNKEFALIEKEMPVPGEGEVLIEIACSAFCGSERQGYLSPEMSETNPGHEFTGVVCDARSSGRLKVGDRVAVHVTVGCGECYYCRIGMQQFCKEMKILEGGHAQYVAVPEKACLPIPEGMTQEEAVLLFADTIGVGYRAVKRMNQDKETPVLVLGAGPIGLGTAALLKHFGYRTILSEPGEYRRNYAAEHDLAERVVDPAKEDPKAVLESVTDGIGPATVIECTGNLQAVMQAVDLVRCGGTVVLAGVNPNVLEISPAVFMFKELTMCGVWYQSDSDFTELIEIWKDGFDALPLISHRGTPEDAPKLAKEFFEGRTAKAVIHWN